jgi:hypothetical protein
MVVLLLLLWLELPLLVLWEIAPIMTLRTTQLSCRWGIHHMVLWVSTARPTTSRGSRHDPLPLVVFSLSTSLHHPLLIYGSTQQVIVG